MDVENDGSGNFHLRQRGALPRDKKECRIAAVRLWSMPNSIVHRRSRIIGLSPSGGAMVPTSISKQKQYFY